MHATSSGKALLASLQPHERDEIVANLALTALTPFTITSRKKLLENVRSGEMQGWFMNREESVEDALAISVRFEWSGSTYTITVAGSLKRMERQLQPVVDSALAAANALRLQEKSVGRA